MMTGRDRDRIIRRADAGLRVRHRVSPEPCRLPCSRACEEDTKTSPPPLGTSDWEVNRNWSFTAIYMHFQPEKFLGETGPSK